MKKFLAILLVVMTLVSISLPSALADGDTNPYQFTFTAQCVNTTSLNHSQNYKPKTANCTIIEVRHSVSGDGSDAGYTNYIYAYISNTSKYVGARWHAPDMVYHSCTSNSLNNTVSVAPGGRGNTKYNENLGLSSITITGQFRPH